MTRVLVLGSAGMLGSMVAAVLAADGLDVIGAGRDRAPALDARHDDIAELLAAVRPSWVINAVGVLRSRIDDGDSASIEEAIDVNGCFPHRVASAAAACGVRVIHPATDAVFDGQGGPYREDAPHDAGDVYGQSKSLGEAPGEHVVNLRCSIVGPELGPPRSLLGWLLAQPDGARVRGYADHRWNGITTLHFARLCGAIVRGAVLRGAGPRHRSVHVVPADVVTKAELLRLLARAHGRDDIEIISGPSATPADRSLGTLDPQRNARLWRAAGHARPPSIQTMVTELSQARQ